MIMRNLYAIWEALIQAFVSLRTNKLRSLLTIVGIVIGVMHVNHMIRGKEANDDEKFCKKLCLQLGVDYHTVKRNVPKFSKVNKISVAAAEAAGLPRIDPAGILRAQGGQPRAVTAWVRPEGRQV